MRGPGQDSAKIRDIAERALIRYFLGEGHDLVNVQGARIKRHEIACSGQNLRKFLPSSVYLEMK